MLKSCRLGLLAAAVAIMAVPSVAQSFDNVLACAGPFAQDADEAALIKSFGAENVTREGVDIGEGETNPGSVLFSNDPKKRIEVQWHDQEKRERPMWITVREGSIWTFATTVPGRRMLAVGANLTQVGEVNGRPFLLNGFGWANGGRAFDWQGGALERTGSACRVTLVFDPPRKITGKTLRQASGGAQFKSTSPAMRAAMPTVISIALSWPE